jgi:hypothetical protein
LQYYFGPKQKLPERTAIKHRASHVFENIPFQTMIRRLGDGTVLALYSQEAITELRTEASTHGISGILLQY